MLIDYHLHIERGPYTLEWLNRFIEHGQALGISEFGFSEHCYRFRQAEHLLDNPWAHERCTQNLDEYVQLILQAKDQGLPVKLGLEVDYIPGKEKEIGALLQAYPFDFVIGSVHWLGDWGFDLAETLPVWQQADINQVYRNYFRVLQQAAKSKLFDILAHLDLVKIYGFRPKGDLSELLNETIATIAQAGCAVEVSTAGLRKPVGEIYPHPDILALCKESRLPITLASDAHAPEQVGENFPKALQLLAEYSITELTRFSQRKASQVQL